MKLFALFGVLALAAGAAPAAASPTFRSDGPNAEAYGAAEGYPVGRATAGRMPLRFMVGSFSHYYHLLRTREVPRGGPVSELRRADPDLALTYLYDGAPRTVTDYVDRNPVTGLLIAKGDTILFEHYQYGRTDRHRFLSQSMAKTVTAMLIGIAVAEGKIASIEDRVERYVPGLAGTEYGGTTLRSLLTMSSGVLFREDYDGADDMARLGRDLFRPELPGPVSAVRQFNTRAAPADSVFHYASIETEILGLVLHEAVGTPVADYLSSRIWQPLGAEADAGWAIDRTEQEATFCCLSATLRDYARLGLMLAHDGA